MKKVTLIIITLGILISSLLLVITPMFFIISNKASQEKDTTAIRYQVANISNDVLKWKPVVEEYARKYNMDEYVDLILAVMQQESSGRYLDLMQCSESGFNTKYSNAPNSITEPEYSIDVGIQTLKNSLDVCDGDIKTALQCYNYGPGFALYVKDKGGYSQSLASEFSIIMAKQMGWNSYGDPFYVSHVFRYYTDSVITTANEGFNELMTELLKHEGKRYHMIPVAPLGEDGTPITFDCSSLIQYCYKKALNIDLQRTAQGIYDQSELIPLDEALPGSILFFKNTYETSSYITHCAVFISENLMYHAASNGVGYASMDTQWFKDHVVCAGRIK